MAMETLIERNSPSARQLNALGMPEAEIESIRQAISSERNALIRDEYDYVTTTYGIFDGSPVFVWESERVPDLGALVEFRGVDSSVERCVDEAR